MLKVSEYVIDTLAGVGIDTCFLVYGGAISDLVGALPGRMKYVVCQHEQAAGFAAEGYAKANKGIGLAIATSGPGGGNLVTAIQNCYYDSTPVVFLTGQVATPFIRPPASDLRQLGFQETPIAEIVRPITKAAATVTDASTVAHYLHQMIEICRSGRPGPALLDLPNDVQRMSM